MGTFNRKLLTTAYKSNIIKVGLDEDLTSGNFGDSF